MWPKPRLYASVRSLSVMLPRTGPQGRVAGSDQSNMVSDPISDIITRIRNGYMAKKGAVEAPWSKTKLSLAQLLVKTNYLENVEVKQNGSAAKTLVLKLKYNRKEPAVTEIKTVSRPSLRVYVGKSHLPRVLGGLGIAVISTPMGLMSDADARKKGLGGEVICEVF